MRLNASALNSRSLNADRRAFVLGSGDALYLLQPELTATRYRHGAGDLIQGLYGDFLASAQRFAQGDQILVNQADLSPTMYRSSGGAVVLGLDSSLYYMRTVQGFGSAELGLHLQGHVGIVFGEGTAVLAPLPIQMTGSKMIKGAGSSVLILDGSLTPSALRRGTGGALVGNYSGQAEASHVHDGVRYVGFAGDSLFSFLAQDGGMLRQSFIGSLDFDIQGGLQGTLRKPTLAGTSLFSLGLEAHFQVIRRGEGALVLPLVAEGAGQIFVRGGGSAAIRLVATGSPSKRTFGQSSAPILDFQTRLSATRLLQLNGQLGMAVGLEGYGQRTTMMDAEAVMDLLSESEAYLNPFSEDVSRQTFSRPAAQREFVRSAMTREWRRS